MKRHSFLYTVIASIILICCNKILCARSISYYITYNDFKKKWNWWI